MDADQLADALEKMLGVNHEAGLPSQWLDTGYKPLNEIISGNPDWGIPYGRIGEIYGPSSAGKTAEAMDLMIQAQKLGGAAIFIDWERSLNVSLGEFQGLNTKRPYWVYLRPKTWEEGNTLAMRAAQLIRQSGVISQDAPIIAVFDSIASALPKSMAEKELSELNMNDTTALARVASTTLKSINQHVGDYNVIAVYLNQIRMKPGVAYGDPTTTPGGTAMEFFASWRLALGRQLIKEGEGKDAEFVGQKIKMTAKKTKFTKPFQEIALGLLFDEDGRAYFDKIGSMLQYLLDNEVLTQAAGRVNWIDGSKPFRKALVEKIKNDGGIDILNDLLKKSKLAA